ncbi:hypothetical protein G9A89_000465, partial [Geosiphon pyriformis]
MIRETLVELFFQGYQYRKGRLFLPFHSKGIVLENCKRSTTIKKVKDTTSDEFCRLGLGEISVHYALPSKWAQQRISCNGYLPVNKFREILRVLLQQEFSIAQQHARTVEPCLNACQQWHWREMEANIANMQELWNLASAAICFPNLFFSPCCLGKLGMHGSSIPRGSKRASISITRRNGRVKTQRAWVQENFPSLVQKQHVQLLVKPKRIKNCLAYTSLTPNSTLEDPWLTE